MFTQKVGKLMQRSNLIDISRRPSNSDSVTLEWLRWRQKNNKKRTQAYVKHTNKIYGLPQTFFPE